MYYSINIFICLSLYLPIYYLPCSLLSTQSFKLFINPIRHCSKIHKIHGGLSWDLKTAYCQTALLSDCFIVRLLYCQTALLLDCFIVRLLYCQTDLLLDCFIVRLLYCQTALLSDCFIVRLLVVDVVEEMKLFFTLKDHKNGCKNIPKCRLINSVIEGLESKISDDMNSCKSLDGMTSNYYIWHCVDYFQWFIVFCHLQPSQSSEKKLFAKFDYFWFTRIN